VYQVGNQYVVIYLVLWRIYHRSQGGLSVETTTESLWAG